MSQLTLRPGDYIVFVGGLKVENVGRDIITFNADQQYTTSPYTETTTQTSSEDE